MLRPCRQTSGHLQSRPRRHRLQASRRIQKNQNMTMTMKNRNIVSAPSQVVKITGNKKCALVIMKNNTSDLFIRLNIQIPVTLFLIRRCIVARATSLAEPCWASREAHSSGRPWLARRGCWKCRDNARTPKEPRVS